MHRSRTRIRPVRRVGVAPRVGRGGLRSGVVLSLVVAATLVATTTPAIASFREDPSFGVAGRVLVDFPGGDREANSVIARPDGSLIVGGETNGGDFALFRLLPDGTFDAAFGSGGFATTDFFGGRDIVNALALQPDGKIVAAGSVGQGSEVGFGVARYLPDGSPDPGFGTGGSVYNDPAAGFFIGDGARAVTVQPDGKIVAAGGSSEDFAVVRFLSDGTLDPGFAAAGVAIHDFGGFDIATGVVVQPDGGLVVVGQGASDFALVRYLSGGALDPTFGSGGTTTTDLSGAVDSPRGLVLQPDGAFVLSGFADGDLALVRYLTGGGLDPGFATGGVLTHHGLSPSRTVALLPDGRLLSGSTIPAGPTEFCLSLIEFTPAGALGDFSASCFGEGTSAGALDLAVLPDGNVVAAGGLGETFPGGAGSRAVVARFTPNQRPVANAGGPYEVTEGGMVTLDATGSTDPDGDPLIYQWDVDNDGTFETDGPTALLAAPRDDATLEVCMRVSDGVIPDGQCTTVTVTNVAPFVALEPDQVTTIDEGEVANVAATFSDPGSLDTYDGRVDWGNDDLGSTPVVPALIEDGPPGNDGGRIEASNRYGDDGSFIVRAEVRDDDGGVGFVETALTVRNVAPTAAVHLSGATVTGGGEALIARPGEEISIEGRSTDPGSDDLTLEWDFGDGSAPVTHLSPVNPPLEDPPSALDPTASPTVQPRDVTDTRTHDFGSSCLYEITFDATDDDGDDASASAAVLITGTATGRQPAGWWLSQVAGTARPPLTVETLECYVGIARFASSTFDEIVPLSGLGDARAVLEPNGDGPSYLEIFDRELLAAYLNFANGAAGWDQVIVDTDGDQAPDTTFGDAVMTAEAIRMDAAATQTAINRQRLLLAQINRVAS